MRGVRRSDANRLIGPINFRMQLIVGPDVEEFQVIEPLDFMRIAANGIQIAYKSRSLCDFLRNTLEVERLDGSFTPIGHRHLQLSGTHD